jgi:glycosyltransferase involved in cell wall biosynthesis
MHFPLSRAVGWAQTTTLHGRLDLPDLPCLYREFCDMPLVSISNSQRQPLAWANWRGTVYHGLPPDLHNLRTDPGDYLVFLGRISAEKRVDRAIEIARQAGIRLKIGAKIDKSDREYFETRIKHLLDDPLVEFVGEVGGRAKDELLGGAMAMLFPIDWPEPFGLVMIESMACGTPVIAWRCGSVPEVIDEGITGFIVESIDEATLAVAKARQLDRAKVRAQFDRRFTAERMARDYVDIYERLIEDQQRTRRRPLAKHRVMPIAPAALDGLPASPLKATQGRLAAAQVLP